MQKLLIAGACGFVGKNLIELLNERYTLIVLDRNIDVEFLAKFPNVVKYRYDFVDIDALHEIIFAERPDYIINLISMVTAERDLALFPSLINTNAEVLLKFYTVLKEYTSLKLFIQFGSAEEYGNIKPPYSEDSREQPDSPYAIVKLLATNISLMLHRNYGFPVTVVRPGNLFGKYQPQNKLIPYMIAKLKRNERIDLTPGEQKRDFIYIKDLVLAIVSILSVPEDAAGQVINLSYGKGVSIKQVVEYLKTKLGSASVVCFGALPYRENEMMNFECDIGKLKRIAKTKFEFDLFSGLDNLLYEEAK